MRSISIHCIHSKSIMISSSISIQVFSISIPEAAAVYPFRYALIQGEVPADSLASFINAQIYPAFRF